MAAAENRHRINDKDIFTDFGIIVEGGLGEFDTPFTPKKVREHNWPGENGIDAELSEGLKRDAKQITLKCYFINTESRADYYTKKLAFENEVAKPGWHTWFNVDHNKAYSFRYEGAKNGNKVSRRYQDVPVIAFAFDLTITVQPELQEEVETDIIVNLNGAFHSSYPAGTKIINIETQGGGVTPSVNILTVQLLAGSTYAVGAVAAAGYTLQFQAQKKDSLLGYGKGLFQNWQLSPVFENLSNGTYRFSARLLEAPTFTDIYETEIVVNYTPPPAEPSLVIENVTADKNTITILARKENTAQDIEYSFDNGATWQASNTKTVPNGTYTPFKARLADNSLNVTYGAVIEIDYTPPTDQQFNTVLSAGQSAAGVTFQAGAGTTFHFNAPLPDDPPFGTSMSLFFGGAEIGLVDFPIGGLGADCAVTYNGTLYKFIFRESDNVNIG